jgi:non-specific serine/threonine protein kinase
MGEVSKELQANRLITLIGVGGVGKTRLAREVALARLGDFPDGVWWIDLAPVEDPEAVLARVADVLGVAAQPGIPLHEVLRRYLAHRTTLLVLDNCEHLAEAAGRAAATVLDAGPRVRVMATSRTALEVGGEIRCVIPPMSLPDRDVPDHIAGASDAERLFAVRAHEADPSAGGDAAGDVARICRRLDGIPLAIEMAAARSRVLAPDQIAARLDERGSAFLSWPDVDRPSRQRTMEAAIAWSYGLLTPDCQIAFGRLAVFAGAFGLDAAEAVVGYEPIEPGTVLDLITSLVDSSMLATVRTDHTVRYRMLQTVREYAHERLSESGEAFAVARRHGHHHLDLLREAGRLRMTPDFPDVAVRLDAAGDDLPAALDWLLENEPADAIQAAAGLAEYWSRRGRPALAYRYGKRMLEVSDGVSNEERAEALLCASFGAALSGDFELAARGPSEAVQLAAGAGWQTRLWAYHALGNIGIILGDLDTVERAGHAILEICDAEGLHLPRAYGTALLGQNEYFRGGDLALAGRYFDAAIEGMRALRDFGGMKIYGLVTASVAAADRGDYPLAETYTNEAIGLPGTAWTAAAYINLGSGILHPQGQLERAGKVLARGTRLAYEAGTEVWMRSGFVALARHAALLKHWEPAAKFVGASKPNLPAWNVRDLSAVEADVQQALEDDVYARLSRAGEAAPPEEVLSWIDEIVR